MSDSTNETSAIPEYDAQAIETKWQRTWEEEDLYKTDTDPAKQILVSEAGLEPAQPFSQLLAPQASASANSATPTWVSAVAILARTHSRLQGQF